MYAPQVPSPPLYKLDMVVHTSNPGNPEVEGGGVQGHLSLISEFGIRDPDSKSQDIPVPYTSKWQQTVAKGRDRPHKTTPLLQVKSCQLHDPKVDARADGADGASHRGRD